MSRSTSNAIDRREEEEEEEDAGCRLVFGGESGGEVTESTIGWLMIKGQVGGGRED